MKTKLFLFATITTVICIILLSACFQTRPKINTINPAFGKYISGYTSGMVSRKSTIRIELSHGINENQAVTASIKPGTTVLSTNTALDTALRALQLPDSALLKDAFTFDPQ